MDKKYLLIGLIIAFIAYAGYTFSESVTPYVGIEEARISTSSVQVKGLLDKKAEAPHMEGEDFVFSICEEDDESKTLTVRYHGTKPDQFDEAYHIVAVGKFAKDENVFKADKLLIKCPSKYEQEKKG